MVTIKKIADIIIGVREGDETEGGVGMVTIKKIMDIIVGVREGFEAEGGVGMVTIKKTADIITGVREGEGVEGEDEDKYEAEVGHTVGPDTKEAEVAGEEEAGVMGMAMAMAMFEEGAPRIKHSCSFGW